MSPSSESSAPETPAVPPGGTPPSSPELVNPKLTANLRADYEALRNDVQQANELAADFQRQLAGKSNEFAQLKQIFEKTQHDLAHLQAGIVALREERHRLANEAMRATAFEMKLTKVTAERDRLRGELEAVRAALAGSAQERERELRERDAAIAELVVEVKTLKQALTEAVRGGGQNRREAPDAKPEAAPRPPVRERAPVAPAEEFIDISFGF